MNDPKENFTWKNKDEGTMDMIEAVEIKGEDGKVKGSREVKSTIKATAEDLQHGIDIAKEAVDKKKIEINNAQKQLESMGKIPIMTSEMVKLQKNLRDLHKMDQAKQLKSKIEPAIEMLEFNKRIIERRQKIMDQRPEK